MSEDNESFGSIFASGIQDVAAILGLLWIAMCDENAALALSKGYLFPAACGMSMFGVLSLSKHLLESSLPEQIAKNIGIDRSRFDKYRLKEKVEEYISSISKEKLLWLQNHGAKIYLDAPALNKSWWMLSLASCFGLSCLNFVPYIPHYYHTPSLNYIYFPLLLTASSFVASFVCCVDSILMLSGSLDLYTINQNMKSLLLPYHFGNRYAMIVTSLIGCISALGIVVGYLGSYLVVKQMAEMDVYLWLGLQFVLCFSRLIIWSLNTEKDDIKKIDLRFKMDRENEKIIDAFQKAFAVTKEKAEDIFKRIEKGDCFIAFKAMDLYLQIKECCYEDDYGIEAYCRNRDIFIKWNKKENGYEEIAILCNGQGIVLSKADMLTIEIAEEHCENYDENNLEELDRIITHYVKRMSGEENARYLCEESELQLYDKYDINYGFSNTIDMLKRVCHRLDYIQNSHLMFNNAVKDEFDQVYGVINL
ncbi:hypothetical protein G6F29_007109 [Rhizopus arrhizus]|uniref:Uncharacterized protein n=1 Tax=Rhizopus oryzae TaxID=64495 RepID=A0A9P7BTI1_RHIOR|nr:hypothetical protein G6F21_008543 [Rhizopus arrhizus]KAG0799526.1 hypothetical protein G6F22_003138 [Rhizopus arrhizus]KAG0826512.1 hypothetical protein G6F19_009256 [Rhizopus arrhizus]KAG0851363.1 hypothetical protein G6F17_009065 [Rhizopus arrhizus]KAG0866508.1 hypothetical protein G6F16_009432 [Rhizopus arrhizus]